MGCAYDVHHAVDEDFRSMRENILGLRTILKDAAAEAFEKVNTAGKDAHRLVKPEVLDTWVPTYEQCGQESGRGLYKRNKDAHRDLVDGEGGEQMYKRAGVAIRKTLNDAFSTMDVELKAAYNAAADQLEEDIQILFDRHMPSDKRNTAQKIAHNKTRLQEALLPHFEALERAWGIEPEPDKEESDEISDEVPVEEIDNLSDGDFDMDEYMNHENSDDSEDWD